MSPRSREAVPVSWLWCASRDSRFYDCGRSRPSIPTPLRGKVVRADDRAPHFSRAPILAREDGGGRFGCTVLQPSRDSYTREALRRWLAAAHPLSIRA